MEYKKDIFDIERILESPFVKGAKAILLAEPHKTKYRGETYEIRYYYYECEKTKITFTTDAIDYFNVLQVYKQYEKKHNVKLNI